jgi:hypothetical protein
MWCLVICKMFCLKRSQTQAKSNQCQFYNFCLMRSLFYLYVVCMNDKNRVTFHEIYPGISMSHVSFKGRDSNKYPVVRPVGSLLGGLSTTMIWQCYKKSINLMPFAKFLLFAAFSCLVRKYYNRSTYLQYLETEGAL